MTSASAASPPPATARSNPRSRLPGCGRRVSGPALHLFPEFGQNVLGQFEVFQFVVGDVVDLAVDALEDCHPFLPQHDSRRLLIAHFEPREIGDERSRVVNLPRR